MLELNALPIAQLHVSAQGTQYTYRAIHFFEESPQEQPIELVLSSNTPQPEVLALLRRPKPGCRTVLEESTQTPETLCVEAASADGTIKGLLNNEPFIAHYDAADMLRDFSIGSAHWVATTAAAPLLGENPFVRGLQVPSGKLVLSPHFPEAKWLPRSARGVGNAERVGKTRCLTLAREELSLRPGARLAVGLVIENARAYPHAWLMEDFEILDPSVLDGDEGIRHRRYLEVPLRLSGRFFMELFNGKLKLKSP